MAPERHGDAALNFRVAHGLAPRVFLGGCFSVYAVDTVLCVQEPDPGNADKVGAIAAMGSDK